MSKFIKDFDYNNELLKIKTKKAKETGEESEKKLNYAIYGLTGEERTAYQLRINKSDILCYHNLRLEDGNEKIQVDFVVISKEYMFLIEVKNLYGNILIHEDKSIDRIIYKKSGKEITGMTNPLLQIEEHINFMQKYLTKNNFHKKIKGLLVMANDKTAIINKSDQNNIIKYEKINNYINNFVKDSTLEELDYDLGRFLKERDKPFSFENFSQIRKSMINSYIPTFKSQEDYDLYVELVKLRKEINKQTHIPLPYIYTNKEIEKLLESKPLTKDEFLSIPGFKEKRYNMYGEAVIDMFKNKN